MYFGLSREDMSKTEEHEERITSNSAVSALADSTVDPLNAGPNLPSHPRRLNEEDLNLLRVRNIPPGCTPQMVVDFFAGNEGVGPVDVSLGKDGVIIRNIEEQTVAYVMFRTGVDAGKGLYKNGKMLGDRIVEVGVCFPWREQVGGSILCLYPGASEVSRSYIRLNDVPASASIHEIVDFLKPYDAWIHQSGPHYIGSVTGLPTGEGIIRLMNERSVFFVYLAKDQSYMNMNGVLVRIRVRPCAYYSLSDMEGTPTTGVDESSIPVAVPDRLPVNLVQRCPPHVTAVQQGYWNSQDGWEYNSSQVVVGGTIPVYSPFQTVYHYASPVMHHCSVVRLMNLPLYATQQHVASLFAGRAYVPSNSVRMLRESVTALEAMVYFWTPEEARSAIGDSAFFILGDRRIQIQLLTTEI